MHRILGFLVLCLALAACAAPEPTRYQASASGEDFGYSEKWLDDSTYEVRFAGNRLTEKETVETYALYRAAELAQEKGYESFALLERTVEEHTKERIYYDSPGFYGSPFYYRPYGWHRPYGYYPRPYGGWEAPRRVTQTNFSAVATVALFTGAPPDDAVKTYEAAKVLAELGPKVVRPKPEGAS